MFPTNSECLIGISDAFFAFCLWVSVVLPTCSLYPQQKCAYSALHPQAWTYIYSSMPVNTYRVHSLGFPKIVYYTEASETEKCYKCHVPVFHWHLVLVVPTPYHDLNHYHSTFFFAPPPPPPPPPPVLGLFISLTFYSG